MQSTLNPQQSDPQRVLIARVEPDAMIAATFGVIPLAIGAGYFVDHVLIQRDAKAH